MPITDIKELRILPPLAIGRLGSAAEPMDNYDLVGPDAGSLYRDLTPVETLIVESDRIVRAETPAQVRFRDSEGRIRPVAPFLELWARFEDGGDLEPLTENHLLELGLTTSALVWRGRFGNLKAFRRTGDENDKIIADTEEFSDHDAKDLTGECAHFKDGNSISFGTLRYLRPTPDFPGIRLRFTPANGLVFGPTAGDPNIADDVYDAARGNWDNHFDGDPSAPPSTAPGGIYRGVFDSQTRRLISSAYLDDACDGIVEVALAVNTGGVNRTLSAYTRVSSGPPDFAPDSLHARTVADELEQMALGPAVEGSVEVAEVQEILQRGLDTVRLMNPQAMNGTQGVGGVPSNRNNMSGHDNGRGRAFEPIYPPNAISAAAIRAFHEAQIRAIASGAPVSFHGILRNPAEVGDLSHPARRKMPAMMRGSDGQHLALTSRQRDKVRAAQEGQVTQPDGDPAQDMQALIAFFESRASLHLHLDAGGGGQVGDLFTDPPALIEFLRTGNAQGTLAGNLQGQPLVTPGDPDGSALVTILRNPSHPMHEPFSREVPGVGRTGLEIVERWISSLS